MSLTTFIIVYVRGQSKKSFLDLGPIEKCGFCKLRLAIYLDVGRSFFFSFFFFFGYMGSCFLFFPSQIQCVIMGIWASKFPVLPFTGAYGFPVLPLTVSHRVLPFLFFPSFFQGTWVYRLLTFLFFPLQLHIGSWRFCFSPFFSRCFFWLFCFFPSNFYIGSWLSCSSLLSLT